MYARTERASPSPTGPKPMAEDRCDFPPPGGPSRRTLAPLRSHSSPAHSAMTCALETTGTELKSKLSSVLPASSLASARCRSTRRRFRSVNSFSASTVSSRAAGQPSLSDCSAKVDHICLVAGNLSSLSSSVSRVASKFSFMPRPPCPSPPGCRRSSAVPVVPTPPASAPDRARSGPAAR